MRKGYNIPSTGSWVVPGSMWSQLWVVCILFRIRPIPKVAVTFYTLLARYNCICSSLLLHIECSHPPLPPSPPPLSDLGLIFLVLDQWFPNCRPWPPWGSYNRMQGAIVWGYVYIKLIWNFVVRQPVKATYRFSTGLWDALLPDAWVIHHFVCVITNYPFFWLCILDIKQHWHTLQ